MFNFNENKNEYHSFLTSALTIHGSVTPLVLKQVFWVVLYATCISLLNAQFSWLYLPIGPFEYAGLIMGLILVFRINAGYDRWWEARKLWGGVVNKSRNMAIMLLSYALYDDKHSLTKALNYISAMPYLMKTQLRNYKDISAINHLVDSDTFTSLEKAEHRPNIMSLMISNELQRLVAEKRITDFAFLKAEEQREYIVDCQGACERILNTPMPFVMAVKSRRFILLFLLLLPFSLVNISPTISPFITALVGYTLFSLDQIGIELQNPFYQERLSHLPLGKICATIEKNILELQEKYSNPRLDSYCTNIAKKVTSQ